MKLSVEELMELLPDSYVDQRGKNLRGICPWCGFEEFGISLEDGHRFGCYRKGKCGESGNIITLLRFLGRYDEYTSKKATVLPDRIEVVYKATFEDVNLDLPIIKPPVGWTQTYNHPYLESRGFEMSDYYRYPVGTTAIDFRMKKDYVIFLCIQEGGLRGWVARHKATKAELDKINLVRKGQKRPFVPRYRNSESDFAKILYGADELDQRIERLYLVEGIFDKINTDRQLELDFKENQVCVCTFKAGVSIEQLALLKKKAPNLKEIILLYDGDVVKIVKETGFALEEAGYAVKVGFHSEKDPGDMDQSDFFQVLSSLQSPIEFKSFKLEVNKLK